MKVDGSAKLGVLARGNGVGMIYFYPSPSFFGIDG